ncbi:MAG: sec-independent protein translocase protein TatB [Rickettsiales bacterium]|jgi:sec-independent protein translocase protein TatB
MFGISLIEFSFIAILSILIIGPKDLPEVTRYLIRAAGKTKYLISKAKEELGILGKEMGFDEIKNEMAIEIANQKTKIEDEMTTIIDMYGNEHQVSGIDKIRKDKNKEEIEKEIEDLNRKNCPVKSFDKTNN